MKTLDCTPLEARRVFQTRPFKNLAIGGAVFAAVFLLVFLSLNVLVVGLVALVAAAGVYFYLESAVIFIECPKCQRDIDTTTPWLCGFKQCRNENTSEFPFIHECGDCHSAPKAYQCHHCGNLIYLSLDRQQIHAAKCLVAPEPVKVKTVVVVKDVIGDKKAMQKEKISDLEQALKETTLKKEIAIQENRPTTWAVPDDDGAVQMEKEVDKYLERGMSLFAIEEKKIAEAKKKWGHNPPMLALQLSLIERVMLKKKAELLDE